MLSLRFQYNEARLTGGIVPRRSVLAAILGVTPQAITRAFRQLREAGLYDRSLDDRRVYDRRLYDRSVHPQQAGELGGCDRRSNAADDRRSL
jgi:DNA-binding MarR family transcriptional regulator